MNRHPFRWGNLVFGLLFLAVAGTWAVDEQDLLTSRQLGFTASAVLIVLGVVGVAATLLHARPPRPERESVTTPIEGEHHEDPDPFA